MEIHGQIEVDVFCTNCFYNLHGQVVTIDPRLNFPVCRCPECGRFHPAGTGVTSSNVWLRRLASILLFFWVAMVGSAAFAISFACFGVSSASVNAFSYSGQPVKMAGNVWRIPNLLHSWTVPGNYDTNTNGFDTMMWICAGSLFLGFVAGMLCVTLLWHWERSRYLWVMLLPLLPAAALVMIFDSIPEYEGIFVQCILRVLVQTGIQGIGIAVGVLVGRKVSRTIVRMIIPPKPRQALAFLWMVDGMKPPQV